ncbi:MAG: M6 family metalloprotease domain-containing protein [Bacteroidales bacterium]|nr:M6 family metalloprotease domain-containing protein [Bacteroidales bacterium]
MKRIITTAISVLIYMLAAAVPADRTRFVYRQPDGSVITLQRHGDEFLHWTTDSRGTVVEKDGRGFYVRSSMAEVRRKAALRTSSAGERKARASYNNAPATNLGDRKILCLIANFTDSTFVIDNPREKFDAMLNGENYSYNKSIGSVRQYYMDNSNGKYRPSFDVFGPVTLSGSSAFYDGGGGSVSGAILEAYELLKDQINIGDYDTDGDGDIDMVLFYYPGHNEAEGASEESIWPHQATANFGMMGDKRLVRYFCTSELRGSSGATMCNIGTTCHEFAHSLGLPDFYDVDYEKSGGNNENTTGQFDLMTSGCYNDFGRRPPYLNALERNMLGWTAFPEEIRESGDYVLEPVYEDKAYMSVSATEGEFFIYEYRTREGWDSGLTESGLLVYHVDQSENKVPGSPYSASQLWQYTNSINSFYGHPCFYLLESGSGSYVFPGPSGTSGISITSWDGNSTGLFLAGISDSGGRASFRASFTQGRSVLGMVKDTDGNPLPGARVVLSRAAYEFQAPGLLKDDIVATADASGCYRFDLPDGFASIGILTASLDGFVPLSVNIKISERFTGQDFTMVRLGQEKPFALSRCNPLSAAYITDFKVPDILWGMKYSADDVREFAGGSVNSISFMAYADTYTDVYVTVDAGKERLITKKVTDQYRKGELVTVDLSADKVVIPSGKDIFFGFGFTGLDNSEGVNNLLIYRVSSYNDGNLYSTFVTSGPSQWRAYTFGDTPYLPLIQAVVAVPLKTDFSMLGISFISLQNDVPVVHPASGKTVREVHWTLDGAIVAEPPSVTALPGGSHTYVAELVYYDGTSERVICDYLK